MIKDIVKHIPLLADFGKRRDFDICFKELRNLDYPDNIVPVSSEEVMGILQKRYPDLRPVDSEDLVSDFYKTDALKGRLGIVHTNKERNDMTYLDHHGILHCGDRMRHKINVASRLEKGAKYSDFESYFEE